MERKGKCHGKGDGRREIWREEKLKDFFYLLLDQLSTMQEIIKGGEKKKGDRALESKRSRETGRKAGRQKEREEEEGKHYSSVPSKHEMLGYFNKKPPFIWERGKKRDQETER